MLKFPTPLLPKGDSPWVTGTMADYYMNATAKLEALSASSAKLEKFMIGHKPLFRDVAEVIAASEPDYQKALQMDTDLDAFIKYTKKIDKKRKEDLHRIHM